MKRLIQFQLMLVLLLVRGQATIQAKRISQWQAQQQAYSFWGKQMPMKAKAKSRVVSTASLSLLWEMIPTMFLIMMPVDLSSLPAMMRWHLFWVIPQRGRLMLTTCLRV